MGFTVLAWALPVLVVGVILVLVADRRDDDAAGYRTPARYLGAACLLSVFLTLLFAFGVVSQLSKFVVSDGDDEASAFLSDLDGGMEPEVFAVDSGGGRERDDAIWRGAVQLGLLTVAAVGVLVFHRGRRRELLAAPGFAESSAARVDRAYLYVVCFLAVFLALFAAYLAVYGLFRTIAPGVSAFHGGSGERERGIAQLISYVALTLGALVVFVTHWRETPKRVRPAPPAAEPELGTVA